jgi:actin beta/gamma 1
MAPEALFFPDHIQQGSEVLGLHKMTYETIVTCDVDIRKDLYSNVILSGGTTLYPGLPERLEKELDAMCPTANLVKVIAP